MENSRRKTLVIVSAGIGGLTLATAARDHHVIGVERRASVSSVGTGRAAGFRDRVLGVIARPGLTRPGLTRPGLT